MNNAAQKTISKDLKLQFENQLFCECNFIGWAELIDWIESEQLKTLEEVMKTTTIGQGCGSCLKDNEYFLHSILDNFKCTK